MKPAEFDLVILERSGRLTGRRIRADGLDQARHIAQTAGHQVLRCAPVTGVRAWRAGLGHMLRWHTPDGFESGHALHFAQDMATLLQAGVTVRDAVNALASREPATVRRQVLRRVATAMAEGLAFSAALAQTQAFPALLVATVAASEQTGDLGLGLSRYAGYQHNLRAVRDKVVGACVYPMLLLAVGALVLVLLLGVVVPRFAALINTQERDLPLLSRLLMDWGHLVQAHPALPLALLLGLVGAAAFMAVQWQSPAQRRKWLEAIPGLRRLVREFAHLQMYRTAAILTARGLTLHKALTHSMDLLGPADQARLHNGLQRLREGASISAALSGCGLSDVVATSMLSVAERSGAMSEMLDRIADFHERSVQRHIDLASRLVEPALMIVFGILIGGIVVLMYLPIFDLASSFS